MSAATVATGSNPPQKPDVLRSKPRTLVVDDSLTILHAICTLLEHHEVVDLVGRAESGEETLDRALALGPDLVLIDADMPGMSGLRTALMLSQLCPAIKVVLMTMDRNPVILRAGSSCGAYAVIYKPRFLSELAEVLSNDATSLSTSGACEPGKTNKRTATIMR
jgi:DNA-binding NarL/FixJ family response regulator